MWVRMEVRSHGTRASPKSRDVPVRDGKGHTGTTSVGGHVTVEAETGAMWPRAKERQEPRQREGTRTSPPQSLRREQSLWAPELGENPCPLFTPPSLWSCVGGAPCAICRVAGGAGAGRPLPKSPDPFAKPPRPLMTVLLLDPRARGPRPQLRVQGVCTRVTRQRLQGSWGSRFTPLPPTSTPHE